MTTISPVTNQDKSGGVGVKTRPAPPRVDRLPPWDVLLHNDDDNDMVFVVETIVMLTAMETEAAVERMLEAHHSGVALIVSTHREHAELLQEQFTSRGLTVTIERGRG